MGSEGGILLHGTIQLTIQQARDLPNCDARIFSVFRKEKQRDRADPYVVASLERANPPDDEYEGQDPKSVIVAETRVVENDLSPYWDESFTVDVCHDGIVAMVFQVRDRDMGNAADMVGKMRMLIDEIVPEEGGENEIEGWYELEDGGEVYIKIRYVPALNDDESRALQVPNTVFPMRSGCLVKLYQDAHTPAVPPVTDVTDKNGDPYRPPKCWIDTSNAINNAKRFIYIVGWSVNPNIRLVRTTIPEDGEEEEYTEEGETLGELLKRKADEDGVRVLLLLWNEAMSNDSYPPGVMGVGDETTRMYFEGSAVEVVLAPRRQQQCEGLGESLFVTTCYTHHQKCVILDAAIPGAEDDDDEEGGRRRVVAFAGGLDLTDGRYDTPAHHMYQTLKTAHAGDCYNGVCPASDGVGPREPWHDIHMYVEGPAAMDLVSNFVERWMCQADDRQVRLFRISEERFELDWKVQEEDDGAADSWNVQLFRSISSDSAHFQPEAMDELQCRQGRLYESSIQRSYVHHIRRAKKFIYIENQYFMGSSHSWYPDEDGYINDPNKITNLIPMELTSRIERAIREREDFRVYVLVPLHPEGDPTTSAVQEILHWQRRTMDMMYRRIARTLSEEGLADEGVLPTDYLSFFCLGKREGPEEVPGDLDPADDGGEVARKVRDTLRFMLYVHSKMAIFDDEYILVGSANINERSMNGNRDTEICMGAYQPSYTFQALADEGDEETAYPQGDVRTFRLALWAEHCGEHKEEHLDPASVECMASMKELGQGNLEQYSSEDDAQHNNSHLLVHPLVVTDDGCVPGGGEDGMVVEDFPDTGGTVAGQPSRFLPDAVTT